MKHNSESTSAAPARVLFAFSDTGSGHRSAALAIRAALEEASGTALDCDMVDILRVSGVPGLRDAPSLYDQLSTRWLKVYNLSFRITNSVRRVDMISHLLYLQARRHIGRTLMDVNPQLVVVTHPLVHRLVGAARRTYRLPFQMVTVVTDLVSLHASWTYRGVDLCLLPTDEAYTLMGRRGMPEARMRRVGFPVHPKFAHSTPTQAEARHTLQIADGRSTVLLTSGGVGSGRMQELTLALEQAYPEKQLLVITGKNHALYEELQSARRNAHTHIYGFVNNMETLMAASDAIVTKAGPGTLMEALIMRRPVLVTEAVGMQERGNIDFVLNRDLGYFCPTTEAVIHALRQLDDPQRYRATIEQIRGIPADGALQIATILLEQLHTTPGPPLNPRRRLLLPSLHSWQRVFRRSHKHHTTELEAPEHETLKENQAGESRGR